MSESVLLEKTYQPQDVEAAMYQRWMDGGCFGSAPDERPHSERYTIVIPPPNVTGALHLGHALNNTLQDILIRWHRMMGLNTLWLPGTDHAGIATQAVVERRILKEEGKTRHEIGRDELVRRIWQWKDEYERRIVSQLQRIGCSCDWSRQRFTLDDGLARAVRHTFFKLFRDGLIFRGKRLVNWDTQLQTAVADDEVYYDTVKGHFWHFKYPVIDPRPGEPEFVTFATTRPETMLGDVAVAVHPDPEAEMNKREAELRERLATVPGREKPAIEKQLDALTDRRTTHLPTLIKLRDMAADGRKVRLPLIGEKGRDIPLVADEWANPLLGSGCVKITPAHDPNDYEVGQRLSLPMINIMTPDGQINAEGGKYAGLTMPEARERCVADMEALELLESIEDKETEVGHSDRSKSQIQPYLSDQWFVRMDDVPEGVTLAKRNQNRARKEADDNQNRARKEAVEGDTAPGLAQAAMDAVTNGRVKVFPDRYAKTYLDWLGEKRDWCISRQLWWGHRIPVWRLKPEQRIPPPGEYNWGPAPYPKGLEALSVEYHIAPYFRAEFDGNVVPSDEEIHARAMRQLYVCLRDEPTSKDIQILNECGFVQDPDVLDTWFSSALWPYSTLGWPDETADLAYYYPGSVLVTSRDIITNWVARMVLTGLYNMGDIPFDHVYIHAKILDGRGETMSKSKGNGVDPLDAVDVYGADALRYSIADMATETQDVRMPVDYRCPHCEHLTPQTKVVPHNKQPIDITEVKCASCGKPFATQWASAEQKEKLGVARESSEKFEIGRNFCNKLWNSARFAFMNLEGAPCEPIDFADLAPEDRWILGQLSRTVRAAHAAIEGYHFAPAIKAIRDFFWDSFCDWYIELAKPRLREGSPEPAAQQVLAVVLDQVLRLLSPFTPFVTERLWEELNRIAPKRGLPGLLDAPGSEILMTAKLPPAQGYPDLEDANVLAMFEDVQQAVRGIRDLRNKCKVANKDKVTVTIRSAREHLDLITSQSHVIEAMAGVGQLDLVEQFERPRNSGTTVVGALQLFVHDISDDDVERKRLTKELESLDKRLAGVNGKLSNAKFVENAKPEVIEAERQRKAELEQSQAAVAASLAELG